MAKGSKSGTSPAPAEIAQEKTSLKNPELDKLKQSVKRSSLCTPTIDKGGAWSWRGKQLEQIWDTMTAGCDTVSKEVTAQPPVGGFLERFECEAGNMVVVAGNCQGADGKQDSTGQVGFAVVYAAGKVRDESAIQQVLELPLPLAFVCVHVLTTLHRVYFTRDKVLALLNPSAASAIGDVKECISWMRDRLAAVERSPQAILTRCAEIFRTSKEMHAHYLGQVKASGAKTAEATSQQAASDQEEAAAAGKGAEEVAVVVEEEEEEEAPAPTPAVDEEAEEEAKGESTEDDDEDDEDDDDDEDEEEAGSEAGVDDEDESSWPASAALHAAQRLLAQETEKHRAAQRALERAAASLEKAKAMVSDASDALHDERARRVARRERKEEKRAVKQAAKDAERAASKPEGGAPATGKAAKAKAKAATSGGGAATAAKGEYRGVQQAEAAGMNTEANQIAALERLEAKAPAAIERLLTNLRGFSSAALTYDDLKKRKAFDPLRFLVHCDVVVQCNPLGDSSKPGPGGSVGRWFVAMGSSKCVPPLPPKAEGESGSSGEEEEEDEEEDLEDIDDGKSRIEEVESPEAEAARLRQEEADAAEAEAESQREEESVALCLAQAPDGTIVGAVGWYDLGALPNSLEGCLSLSASLPPPRRCVRLDDSSWDLMGFLHMTLQGYGKDCAPIVPMGYSLQGSALFHFAAGSADYHVARNQAEMRLTQGRAGMEEREQARTLLDACVDRLISIAPEASEGKWVPPPFSKCESAVQGLRKTLLRRPWCKRCTSCGVRHEDIEFSTCKFWQAWVV